MKDRLTYIVLLFFNVLAFGQVHLAISKVQDLKVNQRFKLTVLLEITGENMEQETPLQAPDLSKFEIIGSASDRNLIELDRQKGTIVDQLVYQWVLSPRQVGKVKIGSVLVRVNGKTYKTEPFDVNVIEDEPTVSTADKSEINDIYLNLEVKDKFVYKNQPVKAVLRAYSHNLNNFRKVGHVHLSSQKNVDVKPVSFAKSAIESRNGIGSQVIGTFIVFPNETGAIDIKPFYASYSPKSSPRRIASNAVRLNVRKLPSGMPLQYKNAVGNFAVSVNKPDITEVLEVEKPLNISFKLSGKGNLESLVLPKLTESPDYIYYPPTISTQLLTSESGTTGFIIADYVVIPKKPGVITLKFENFSYFEPFSKNYTDLGAQELKLNIQTAQQIAAAKSTLEKVNEYTNTVLETVNTPVLQTQHLKIKTKDTINWKIVFGNFALLSSFALLFLLVVRKKEKRKIKRQNIPPTVVNKISIEDTEDLIRQDFKNQFEDNIEYLKILKDNNEFSNFFSAYEALNLECKELFGADNEAALRKCIENTKGQYLSEEYRILSEKIQMEKYSPLHTSEEIDGLFGEIKRIYSQFNK